MYDFALERMWAQREEAEQEEMMMEQAYWDQREREAYEEREYERWLEKQYYDSLEGEEYESYRATD